jgi:membrane-associated phospholipid phosphatase
MQFRLIGGTLAALAASVLGFSWFQVRAGRWSHVDASARKERTSLNVFLAVLLVLSAALLWLLTPRSILSMALALSGALIVVALLTARWVKVSLHAAFAAFAAALLWPIMPAFLIGVIVTAAVVWSRLILGRHVVADVVAGLLFGTAAGAGYQLWVV